MFQNPNTLWIEILVLVAVVAFLGFLIGRYIYKKKHNLPTGECSYCAKGKNKMVKDYHKFYSKTKNLNNNKGLSD